MVGLTGALALDAEGTYAGLATIIGGLLGGLVYRYRPDLQMKVVAGFIVGALSHTIWMGLVFAHDPLVGTWDALLLTYGWPVLLNGATAALFIMIIGDIRAQQEKLERMEVSRALRVANRVLPRMRYGINEQSAAYIADIIRRLTGVTAAAIRDNERILAVSCDRPDSADKPDGAWSDTWSAPLTYEDQVIGSVELREDSGRKIPLETAELGQEVAQFLSNYQMQMADLEKRTNAASKAELRALQAQVHPHFLFNALNTLASFCETDPSRAAELAIELGAYFRSALNKDGRALVRLEEELANVRYYLKIEKARFGNRFGITEEIDDSTGHVLVPSLSIQPLVENAVLHGLSARPGDRALSLVVRVRRKRLECWVLDNGAGMDRHEQRSCLNNGREPHGLIILKNRLDKLYHGDFRLALRSTPGVGTAVLMSVPLMEQDG
jgi:LytS/YehU family sensor histidine kinase